MRNSQYKRVNCKCCGRDFRIWSNVSEMAFDHQLIWAQPRSQFTLFDAQLVCPFNRTTVVENVTKLFKEYIGGKSFQALPTLNVRVSNLKW